MLNIKIIRELKERANEMLNGNYSRKISEEEIYTIICEYEELLNRRWYRVSEEEIIEKLSNYLKDSLGKDLIKALKTTLDKLQKENEDMREELQMYVDTPINKLIVENEELQKRVKVSQNFAKIVERDYIDKDEIRNKIKELEEELIQNYGTLGESFTTTEIKTLKELLGE